MTGAALRPRLLAGERLIGTFVKIPHPHVIELLAGSGFDFLVLDAEHAPFDFSTLDTCLMAARLLGIAALVRVPAGRLDMIGAVLDLGAAGVVAAHVDSPQVAGSIVGAARYAQGRGMSGSTRAANYGRADLAGLAEQADRDILVVAQIEDAAAIGAIGAIARTPGIDCCFIGPADLMMSLGAKSMDAPELAAAIGQLETEIRQVGNVLGSFATDCEQARDLLRRGCGLIVAGTDQALLTKAATRLAVQARVRTH